MAWKTILPFLGIASQSLLVSARWYADPNIYEPDRTFTRLPLSNAIYPSQPDVNICDNMSYQNMVLPKPAKISACRDLVKNLDKNPGWYSAFGFEKTSLFVTVAHGGSAEGGNDCRFAIAPLRQLDADKHDGKPKFNIGRKDIKAIMTDVLAKHDKEDGDARIKEGGYVHCKNGDFTVKGEKILGGEWDLIWGVFSCADMPFNEYC
ncbi:hypothetical protein F4778DRAFT_763560 [Xylariomycetidae sp. FL2044]|nr:hypothetical protein F4778DRAFT_763560 [Xylariomycetidae sp. FL2044]